MNPASPARRGAATLVDVLLVVVPYALALNGGMPDPVRVAAAAAVLFALAAQAWLLASRAQTAGKIWFHQRVARRATGENPGFLIGAIARPFAAWGPNLLCLYFHALPVWLLLDALFMIRREDGLSLHDLLCGTRVVGTDSPLTDSAR